MEIVQELSSQYVFYIPVALVIFAAILVFAFGFKSPEQPPFDKLSNEDRKSAGKKRKPKDKKSSANGHISTGDVKHEKSPTKEIKKSLPKETSDFKQEKKEKKSDNNKQYDKLKKNEILKSKNIEELKNKKNVKKPSEKPVDFDDGDWERVPTKGDKKKKEQSPAKNDKKAKKFLDKVEKIEIEKLAKEVVNQELREKEKKEEHAVGLIPKEVDIQIFEPVAMVVEEKKDKKRDNSKKEATEKPQSPVESLKAKPALKESFKEEMNIEKNESNTETNNREAVPVFDELGDVWTEAKVVKKTKKKARRDN